MGMSSSKSKTKEQSSATTTPTAPTWLTAPVQGLTGKINDFMNTDPNQYVAGASPLQQQAFAGAGTLGQGKAATDNALGMAATAGAGGPNLAQSSTATAALANAPKLGAAAQMGQTNIAPTTQAQASLTGSESMLDNLNSYMDPALNSVLKTSLADYDADEGQRRAALQAAGARGGAFGGSRFGIAEGQFEGDSARGRGALDAGIRSQIFSQGLMASGQDAQRRQDARTTNAGLLTNISGLNAGAENNRAMGQADLNFRTGATNMDAQNMFKRDQFGVDASMAEANAARRQQTGMFNTDAANRASQFNAQQQETALNRALAAAGLTANIGTAADASARADLGLAADLGEMQRQIAQAQALAPLAQLQAGGDLLGGLPYPAFVGQQTNGTLTGTTKTKGSLFDSIMQLGSKAAQAYASGGGG